MADLDAIYNAYNEIMDAKDKASEHLNAYNTIIAASQGSDGAKRLASQFIPTFFKHFPTLHTKAIDGIFDLCEDDSNIIRQSAIKSLPSLCKDGPQHTIKIADVLCQLLQLDDQDLVVVQGALHTLMLQSPREVLAVLFRQGVKGADLRERSLDFITNQVMSSKDTLLKDPEIELFFLEEMQKAMGSVSNSELEIFAKIIMQTKSYQSGRLDLTGLSLAYIAHITSENPFNIKDQESVKRLLVAGKLSMPLFKRTITADPLLEFFAVNVLPRKTFDQLMDKQKTSLLRLYTDSMLTGHPSPTIIKSAGSLLTDILVATVPAEQSNTTPVDLAQVECLTILLFYIAAKEPELIENEELTSRFKTLYVLTQRQLSSLKDAQAVAQAKKPQDAEAIKNLTKTITIHNNIHTIVKEFMKPKHLRRSQSIPNPSWRHLPEAPKSNASNVSGSIKSSAAIAMSTLNPSTKARVVPSSRSLPSQQKQQVSSNKRKPEQDLNSKPKKPKIVRQNASNTSGLSPGNSSPVSHGNKQHQQVQHGQHSSQPSQGSHGKKGNGGFPPSFDNRRARDNNGRINFLKR